LLCQQEEWRRLPTVVVAEDKPQALILWVNDCARKSGVLPGQKYAQGLSLERELRAGVVPEKEIEEAIEVVCGVLRKHTPDVEPDGTEPGVFWLGGDGLRRVYGSPAKWMRQVLSELKGLKYTAAAVVGFSRFGTYALVRARGEQAGATVLKSAEEEEVLCRKVPLAYLNFDPVLRDEMAKLGVTRLGEFVRLPRDGLAERYGGDAEKLHRLASFDGWDPLSPRSQRDPLSRRVLFDDPEQDSSRLMFALRRPLDELLLRVAEEKCALVTLFVQFEMDRPRQRKIHAIRPAEPTLQARVLLRLLHLRLEACPPSSGVREAVLSVEDIPATREQLSLFAQRPRRDLRAAEEAFARLRAEMGNEAVVSAALKGGHLPEGQFCWQPLLKLNKPEPAAHSSQRLIRRLFEKPSVLPRAPKDPRNDGWLLLGLLHGPLENLSGPYTLSGGWWNKGIHREYHYAEMASGKCVWIFYDRVRRRWFLHGQVE